MADKILRITFNGICTLTPPPPRDDGDDVDKVFVLMAANRTAKKNDWGSTVEQHFPFIYVPEAFLTRQNPPPDATTFDHKLGRCNIYFIDHARVVIDKTPTKGIGYCVDKRPLAERPGSDDVAPENDIRWVADFRDILQGPAKLRKTIDLSKSKFGPDLAVLVELKGGLLQASFPCKSVQPKTFKDVQGHVVPGLKRVLANEFLIDIPFAEATKTVKIQLRPLRPKVSPTGLGKAKELVLTWPDEGRIEMRMGNDARSETLEFLGKPKRCHARKRDAFGRLILIPRDNDFYLHYRIIDSGRDGGPLPQSNIQQIHIDGCKVGG